MSQPTPFFGNIDLRNNELVAAVFENRTTHPTNAKSGRIYYNTDENAAFMFVGGDVWVNITQIYNHPKYQELNPELTGAHVLASLIINDEGHVLGAETRALTLADLGFNGDVNANNYEHPIFNVSGTGALTGAQIVSNISVNTNGHVTGMAVRELTASDIGAAAINDSVVGLLSTWSSTRIQASLVQLSDRFEGVMVFMGAYDIQENSPNIVNSANKRGHCYIVTGGDGYFNGRAVLNGSLIISNIDNPQSFADWVVVGDRDRINIENATEETVGIIRIATDLEIIDGISGDTSVTPRHLNIWFENSPLNDYDDPFDAYLLSRGNYLPRFISFEIDSQPNIVEVGTTLNGIKTFNWSVSDSDVPVDEIDILDVTTDTTLVGRAPNVGTLDREITTVVLNSEYQTQTWVGAIENPNDVDDVINSAPFTVTAQHYRYYGAVGTLPTNNSDGVGNRLYADTLNKEFHKSGSNVFQFSTGTTHRTFVVMLPPNKIILSVFDTKNGRTDITSNYVQSTIIINDVGGTPRTYNIYTMTLGVPYSESANHVFETN